MRDRFYTFEVSGYSINPRAGFGTAKKLGVSVSVLDRAYAHDVVARFTYRHGKSNEWCRRKAAEKCAFLNALDRAFVDTA